MGRKLIAACIAVSIILCQVYAQSGHSVIILMDGTELCTEVYIADSGRKGPTVVVIGGIHGDETAGILASEALSRLMPCKGRMVVLPRANKPSCSAGVRTVHYMEDLNRCFPGDMNKGLSGYAAFMLVEAIRKYEPAIVIDLHESRKNYGEAAEALGQSLVISEQNESAEIVLDILEELNDKVEAGMKFTFESGAPEGSFNREVSGLLDVPAVTVETWSGQEEEERVRQQILAVKVIIKHLGMLEQ